MDPVSYLFSAYLKTVQNEVHQSTTEIIGTELKAVVVEYEDALIPFQYQLWKVKPGSVCSNSSGNIVKHSECTQKASRMFSDVCESLSNNPVNGWKYIKTKNMYCNAAVSYRPVVAKISEAKEKSELSKAKSACSAATVAAMGSNDPKLRAQRKQICKEYESLKKIPKHRD